MQSRPHAVVDTLGSPLCIHLTAGNVNGIGPACSLMEDLPADKLLVDRAHDANKLLASAEQRNHEAVIPPMSGRLIQQEYDAHTYNNVILLNVYLLS